jgi:catechol 2,3-dioxygenase-like lactoylglutathione lyase family enzyme
MAVNGIYYVLAYSTDLDRSKQFYGETLGWELGTDEYGIAGFSFGSGYLIVHEENRAPAARTYGGGMQVTVQVTDINAEHARLKKLGLAVSELRDQPWGERNFDFSDPDGYTWSYGQEIAER